MRENDIKNLIKKIKKNYRRHILGCQVEFEFDEADQFFNQDGSKKKYLGGGIWK